jgi:hypothetical protein
MFDSLPVDVTAIHYGIQAQAMMNKIATPVARQDPPPSLSETGTVTIASPFKSRVLSHTQTGHELLQSAYQGGSAKAIDSVSVEDSARRARVALLVKKHEGKTSREDGARLAILTERIRKLDPRVTTQQLDSMADMVGQLESVSTNLDLIREKYALR